MAAALGQSAVIFVPQKAPQAKVAQLLIYGAHVLLVEGTYNDAFELCQESVAAFGFYDRSCAVNPFLIEGKKTGGLEIAEQTRTDPADVVVVSVGDGCTVAGIVKGMRELVTLGLAPTLPRVLGVQARGAPAIAEAFARGSEQWVPQGGDTVADSIAVSHPRNAVKALRAVRQSSGTFVTVSDDEILAAVSTLARTTGVFAEPTAAATVAGVLEARRTGWLGPDADVLILITGNGLKDVTGALRAAPAPLLVAPRLEAVRTALAGRLPGL